MVDIQRMINSHELGVLLLIILDNSNLWNPSLPLI